MSHARAASVAATRSFVTPASADTTTIGSSFCRSATISMAFATRCASPTEVPPNLMMITAARSQKALRLQQLRIQDRCAGGAADRVVHESHHAEIEQRAGAEPAHGDAHAALAVAIEARLRAIVSVQVVDRLARSGRKSQRLRLAAEVVDRLAELIEIHEISAAQPHGDGHQMSIDRRHAVHLRRDAERRVDESFAVPSAQDLLRLRLDLLFFATTDVG